MPTPPPALDPLPLVGRARELARSRERLDRVEAGHGGLLLLSGEGGIGKTRLAAAILEEGERRDWGCVTGGANPVESGVPYALFSDALLPALARLDEDARVALTRGVEAELAVLFPTLATEEHRRVALAAGAGEFKSRVFWNAAELVRRYTKRAPLLVVLEDLHWADSSSLELLHFLARHIDDVPVLIVGTYKPSERDARPALRSTLHSLGAQRGTDTLELVPLGPDDTEELVCRVFETDATVARTFARTLHAWTDGNPFFLTETLKELVQSGRLRRDGDRWMGWEVTDFDLPGSVRDAILQRLRPLDESTREVADLAATLGMRMRYDTLAAVAACGEDALLEALEALVVRGILLERESAGAVLYEFPHALVRETLYTELGPTRSRRMHRAIAERLEEHYGARADEHADELAYHFSRTHGGAQGRKAVRYLAAAGRSAFAKYANGEAEMYLAGALARLEAEATPDPAELADLRTDLARTRQRLGDYDGAMALWAQVRDVSGAAGDQARVAAAERRMGLACFWTGRFGEAIAHYDAGLDAARLAGDLAMQARISVAKGMCLHDMGRPDEAKTSVEHALSLASGGEPALLARVHRALMLLHVWTGPAELARRHGEEAIRLAHDTEDRTLVFSAHWGMGVLEGLRGNSEGLTDQIGRMRSIAEEIDSPVLRAWTAELEIEYAAGRGEWDEGIALGEKTITVARALNQSILVPRLLVWTALMYLPRGEIERGEQYVEEAWKRSGAGTDDRPPNLHTVIPAYIGRAALHLARGEYEDAIRVGEAGLEIADRHGYVAWSIHRLVPIITESALWLGDLDRARRLGERLRRDSEVHGHRLGLAWAHTCDAVVAWLGGDPEEGAVLLDRAAVELEAIPFVFDAARARRQLAGRLADMGDREGSLRELRLAHDVFVRLGAEEELAKARDQFREVGSRPPARALVRGGGGLTGRELEIARLVRERKSNKAIGKALGISVRTVSTHLSNIYRKLEISTRGELADWLRANPVD